MVASMLEGQVKGKVYIGRMSGGFFNGVTIDSLEIRDDEDSVFVASGPIRVSYDPRDLFDRRILLSNLQVQHPVVHLRQHENGDWNWRRIFPASVEKQQRNQRGFGQYVVIDSSEIHDAVGDRLRELLVVGREHHRRAGKGQPVDDRDQAGGGDDPGPVVEVGVPRAR